MRVQGGWFGAMRRSPAEADHHADEATSRRLLALRSADSAGGSAPPADQTTDLRSRAASPGHLCRGAAVPGLGNRSDRRPWGPQHFACACESIESLACRARHHGPFAGRRLPHSEGSIMEENRTMLMKPTATPTMNFARVGYKTAAWLITGVNCPYCARQLKATDVRADYGHP